MKISEITYSRKKNLGNHESEELSLTGVSEEGEDIAESISRLKGIVNRELGISKLTTVQENTPTQVKKPAATPKKEEVTEEEPKKEPASFGDNKPKKEQAEVEGAEKKKRDTKSRNSKRKADAKGIKLHKYDRTIKSHKDAFAEFLNDLVPNWSDIAVVKKEAIELSKRYHGKDFFDEKGDIIREIREYISVRLKEVQNKADDQDL